MDNQLIVSERIGLSQGLTLEDCEHDIELARMHGEIQWISRINKALENNYFVLYRQPIVSINNGEDKTRHYEILIRLKEDGNSRIISPGAFLPAAERYNMATRIDRWVFNATFDFLSNNHDNLEQVDLCSINLSGKSLADDAFLQFITDKITESENLAGKLCFEITDIK